MWTSDRDLCPPKVFSNHPLTLLARSCTLDRVAALAGLNCSEGFDLVFGFKSPTWNGIAKHIPGTRPAVAGLAHLEIADLPG